MIGIRPTSERELRRAVAQLLRLFPDRPLGGANLFELAVDVVDELAGVDLRRDVAEMSDELEAWQDQRAKDLDREYEASAMARSTLAGLSPRGEDLDRVLRWALERLMADHEDSASAVLVEARAETGIGLEAFWLSDRGRR